MRPGTRRVVVDGVELYDTDVLDNEEIGQDMRARQSKPRANRAVPATSTEQAEREHERAMDDPWGIGGGLDG